MAQQLTTLETKIDTNDIPTCVCEKSLADKVEKGCLKCGYGLGTVAPTVGLIGSVAIGSLKNAALKIAIDEAIAEGAAKGLAAGTKAGIQEVMKGLYTDFRLSAVDDKVLGLVLDGTNYNNVSNITTAISTKFNRSCMPSFPVPGAVHGPGPVLVASPDPTFCSTFDALGFGQRKVFDPSLLQDSIKSAVNQIVTKAETAASTETAKVTASETETLKATNIAAVEAATTPYYTPIIASIIAIEVIVLIMVIIYLILRTIAGTGGGALSCLHSH
ncbi:hypothetical protein PFTANZ_06081 [Plasmodium falciparum Tanzania (2000708)]|uniref:Surface antigen n=1 Tax=Plasmodium falciparum Tanzania (2000708) TaxID=1036725 RepID=A0A024VZ61_PLAFA|nr:hypothetical protein PFTANZ_06081 [Plasmodium falciparum Tanzania (2000708)]